MIRSTNIVLPRLSTVKLKIACNIIYGIKIIGSNFYTFEFDKNGIHVENVILKFPLNIIFYQF